MLSGIIESLNTNVLFQASLGSKELFHSNILAWLLDQKNKDGSYLVLTKFISLIINQNISELREDKYKFIYRERDKIDIIIKWFDGDAWNFIFIENKMKSIPTLNQLVEYDNKIFRIAKGNKLNKTGLVKKLLLTPFSDPLISNNFNSSVSQKSNWLNISYSDDILPFLKNCINLDYENDVIPFVIKSYVSLIEDQNKLISNFHLDAENKDFKFRKYDFYSSKEMAVVRDLKLHDLILKMAHSKIELLLRESFKTLDYKMNRFETSFTNSTGLSSVDVEIQDNYFVGIQLQGNQFRYYISTTSANEKDIRKNERLAVKLFSEKLWFHDLDTGKPLSGKGKNANKYKELGLKDEKGERSFCEFSKGAFVYFYKELNAGQEILSVSQVVDLFVKSFRHYFANKNLFINILEQIK